jgi:phosphonate transport system substrate-binding protein
MIRRTLMAGVLAATALLSACAPGKGGGGYGTADKPIAFSILSAETQASMGSIWAPVLEDLHKQTGLYVKPYFASNYSGLIEAMKAHQVQMGWFSALPALEAARRADGQVIVRVANETGSTDYESQLIAHAGSGITLDKLLACGKRYSFGLGDAKSTSGTLAPMAFLFGPKGIDPSQCFKTVRSASHQANLFSVANGVLDIATGNTVGMMFAKRDNPAIARKVAVIWESPPLPESAIVVRHGDLDPATVDKLVAFFEHYGQSEGAQGERERAALKKLTYSKFLKADNGYLMPVRKMEAGVAVFDAKKAHDDKGAASAQALLDALNGPNPPPITPVKS